MSLNIKNAETHELVQELAALTGETQTTAVTKRPAKSDHAISRAVFSAAAMKTKICVA